MEFGEKPEFLFTILSTTRSRIIAGILTVLVISSLIHLSTSSNRVNTIHNYDMTGNLGGGEAYDIHLANGEEIHLTSYTNRHPLCQGTGNISSVDCSEYGETEVSPGFENAEEAYRSRMGLSYGKFENKRFGPIATCYNKDSNSFYTCVPSPINIGSIATKSLVT